jgi:prepilin-type N-terminal cleavage/methylation domain-containing protein
MHGFTLVEMLISVVILVLVLGLSTYSYQYFARNWQKISKQYDKEYDEYEMYLRLDALIRKIAPYVLVDNKKNPKIHFQGGPGGFVSFSLGSQLSNELAAYIELATEIESETNKQRIILYETPFSELLLKEDNQRIHYQTKMKIYVGLDQISFSYLGPREAPKYTEDEIKDPQMEWQDYYSSYDGRPLPKAIRISFLRGSKKSTFNFYLVQSSFKTLGFYREKDV